MRIHCRILLLAAACLLVNPLAAQPVPEVLVTGTVIDDFQVSELLPREVLTAEDIAALSPSSTAALLRSIPGLDVTQQGGEGGLTFVSIRGGDPNFTVVMIDGVKVDDPTNSRGGGYDFGGLDPLMIQRIEVLYGSYSAIYGSDALAGVISVTTRSQGGPDEIAVDLEAGTDDAWAAAAHLAGDIVGGISGGVSAAIREGNEAVEGDSLDRGQLAARVSGTTGTESGMDWNLRLFASDAESTAFPQASGGDQLAVIREVENRDSEQLIFSGDAGFSPTDSWRIRLAGAWNEYEEDTDSPGIAPGAFSGIPPVMTSRRYERSNAVLSNTLNARDRFTLGFGGELIWEDADIASLIDFGFPVATDFSTTRDTWALFAEGALALSKRIDLIASLRHDDAEEIDSTTGRIAASADFPESGTTVWLIYGESFKLPSLFALGDPLTGNPDLDPEESQNLEFRIEQATLDNRLDLAFSVYRNEFDDLVDFDAETFTHVNRSGITTQGADLGLSMEVNDDISLFGNLGYLDTDADDGTRLERRPDWKGSLTASWQATQRLLLTARGVFNDEFYDVAVPTGLVQLDSYSYLDANAQWSFSQNVSLKLMISNAFDQSFEESVGFSNPGRQVRIGLSVRL